MFIRELEHVAQSTTKKIAPDKGAQVLRGGGSAEVEPKAQVCPFFFWKASLNEFDSYTSSFMFISLSGTHQNIPENLLEKTALRNTTQLINIPWSEPPSAWSLSQ